MMTSSNSQNIQNWVNLNKELLRSYKGEWIAYDETGFLTSAKTLDQVCQQAELVSQNYLVYFVDPYRYGKINFRPIHFRI